LIIDEEDLDEAIRDLVRIGFDRVAGYAEHETLERYFEDGGEAASIPEIDWEGMRDVLAEGRGTVLDVRYRSEWNEGHVPDAVNASYTRLPEYGEKLAGDGPWLVHCRTGARAAVAASYLAREGRDERYVSDLFETWESTYGAEREEAVPA
ncbi:MAG: rhodanese-like domain-containing protein, partial [Gemmatimonadota bacterium]|nr:rhodanese-like domain-containing protein [Gemmatimonadota bacterium]